MHPIAHIESCFATKFGIPRQAGIVDTPARIVFEPEYRVPEAVRGLEDFEYIWLIWQFSEAVRQDWSPTVRPPRLGGNRRMGVFATRSPFRPNALGLSSVRLTGIEQHATLGAVLHVTGADLMDGTPIYDIKPYLPYTDSHPDARSGFAPQAADTLLEVQCPQELLEVLPPALRQSLTALLAHDPRPQYQHDPGRLYGMEYGGCEIKFRVTGRTAVVERIDPKRHDDGAAHER
jgi:tRNA-Thr(GGU) m(6)t(6)A37 methyltransferase TsaA